MLQLHLSDQQVYWLLRCDFYQRFDSKPYAFLMYENHTLVIWYEDEGFSSLQAILMTESVIYVN